MSDEKKSLRCSFCGKREEEVRRMIQAPGARICDQCIQLCMSVLEEELRGQSPSFEEAMPDRLPTPKEIKEVLDQAADIRSREIEQDMGGNSNLDRTVLISEESKEQAKECRVKHPNENKVYSAEKKA